jgi:hypothetical protein
MVPHAQTDTNGRFAFAGLTPGPEYMSAFKESAFYPKWVFWNPRPGSVSIDLPKGGAISDIVLKVSPAARLVVKAVNARTGAAIDSIGVRREGDGAPDQAINGSRMDHAWLVPTVPFRVRVDATGFESAWYSGDHPAGHSSTLLLAARETRTIIVSLTPTSKDGT